MYTYPRCKTNYEEIFISDLPLTCTQLKCNNNKNRKSYSKQKHDKCYSKLLKSTSSNTDTNNNIPSSSTNSNSKYKILTKYYHDKETRKSDDNEVIKQFEYLKQNYLKIINQYKKKEDQEEEIVYKNTNQKQNCNNDSSNSIIESNSISSDSSSKSCCNNNNSCSSSISSNSSIHSYFSIKSEYCCTKCENILLMGDDDNENVMSNSPISSSLIASSYSSSSSLLSTNNQHNENTKHFITTKSKNEGYLLNEGEIEISVNNFNEKTRANSNATLDQLIKSLDDINLYLEKTFNSTNISKQNQQHTRISPSLLNIKESSIISNRFKNPLIHEKYCDKKQELNDSPKLNKIDIKTKIIEQSNLTVKNKTSYLDTNFLNKYSYLNFNKNKKKQMSIEISNGNTKNLKEKSTSSNILSISPKLESYVPYSSSTLYIPKVNSDNNTINLQVKSCSHDTLNSINTSSHLDEAPRTNHKITPLILEFQDAQKKDYLSPKNTSKSPASTGSTSPLSPSFSSLSSSLAKLSESRSNSVNSSANRKKENVDVSKKVNSLTVESLFRDLMLDCDETVKKLDEIENLKKLYQLKQETILKALEIKNLISIFQINKRKQIRKAKQQKQKKRNNISSINQRKNLLSNCYLKKIVQKSLSLDFLNLNGNKLLIIKKLDKIPILNRLVYRYKLNYLSFTNCKKNISNKIYNLYVNSNYINYSLCIGLNSGYKVYLNKSSKNLVNDVKNKKNSKVLKDKIKFNIKKFDDSNLKLNGHKSLLDEYYEKYCAITTKNNNKDGSLSNSLKLKKRSRTEERLNELERDQAFFINDCLKMKNLEVDLVAACKWLIEAGFSKYVELFENNKFPIDITYVEFENPNLNDSDLKAIFRRLEVLNKCSEMRLNYKYIKNEYENPDDDDDSGEEDNSGDLETNRNINLNLNLSENMNNTLNKKKQQQKLNSNANEPVKLRKIDSNSTTTTQARPKPSLHRFYSFQNHTSSKFNRNLQNRLKAVNNRSSQTETNNNDGYVDDVEDNGEDDDNDSVISARVKAFSLQPNSKYFSAVKNAKTLSNLFTIDNLISAHKLNLKQKIDPKAKLDVELSSQSSTASDNSVKLVNNNQVSNLEKSNKAENTQQKTITTVNKNINFINQSKVEDSRFKSTYSKEDNNINLAFVKLNKRKKIPENYIHSVYDNLKSNKNEMESDDSLLNMTSSINYKIANFVPTSSSTFSTNSSNQSSPSLLNKVQNINGDDQINFSFKISADSETLLPKIFLNDDEDEEQTFIDYKPERRDSGVGRSLTRENDKRINREKWQSFIKSHRPSLKSSKMQLSSMNILQYSELRPFALVKITSLMEDYSQACQKSGWNRFRTVPKFIKRHQRSINENTIKNKNVFGVPFKTNIQRHGQPLPQPIIQIMKYVRNNAKNTTGVFRKSGAKSRMMSIREEIEKKLMYVPDNEANKISNSGIDSQTKISNDTIDAADLLKQYFRELPECLLTNKLSQTLIDIFIYVPEDQRLEAIQYCMLLLDDENRDVLQCLLFFLNDISQHHEMNKMDSKNIAICLAPTLLNLNALKEPLSLPLANISNNSRGTAFSSQNLANSSSNLMSQSSSVMKDPTQLINRQCNASLECLSVMIQNPQKIFQVPKEALVKIQSRVFDYQTPIQMRNIVKTHSLASLNSYLNDRIDEMLKELKEKTRSWTTIHKNDSSIEISHKKIDDGNPLRLWKLYTEIDAPAKDVFQKLYDERTQWDDDLIDFKITEKIDNQIDIIQYEMHVMPPQASRGYCELRINRNSTQLPQKYSYVILSTSIEPLSNIDNKTIGDIMAITLRNCYIIEANETKTKLYQLHRGDYKGYSSEWYHKMEGHVLKRSFVNLKHSFIKKTT